MPIDTNSLSRPCTPRTCDGCRADDRNLDVNSSAARSVVRRTSSTNVSLVMFIDAALTHSSKNPESEVTYGGDDAIESEFDKRNRIPNGHLMCADHRRAHAALI
jgi:hypothetical protein